MSHYGLRVLHYFKVLRYIEANPLAAGMVQTAGQWPWSSFARRFGGGIDKPFKIDAGPLPVSENWKDVVNRKFEEEETTEIRHCIKKGCPYGAEHYWTRSHFFSHAAQLFSRIPL